MQEGAGRGSHRLAPCRGPACQEPAWRGSNPPVSSKVRLAGAPSGLLCCLRFVGCWTNSCWRCWHFLMHDSNGGHHTAPRSSQDQHARHCARCLMQRRRPRLVTRRPLMRGEAVASCDTNVCSPAPKTSEKYTATAPAASAGGRRGTGGRVCLSRTVKSWAGNAVQPPQGFGRLSSVRRVLRMDPSISTAATWRGRRVCCLIQLLLSSLATSGGWVGLRDGVLSSQLWSRWWFR